MSIQQDAQRYAKRLRERAERIGTREAWNAWQLAEEAARQLADAGVNVEADEVKVLPWLVTVRVSNDMEIVVEAPDGELAMKVAREKMKKTFPEARDVIATIARKLSD